MLRGVEELPTLSDANAEIVFTPGCKTTIADQSFEPEATLGTWLLTRTKTWLMPEASGCGSTAVPLIVTVRFVVINPLEGLVMTTFGALVSACPPGTICKRRVPTLPGSNPATAIR